MYDKNPMRRKPVSWKTKLGAVLFSMMVAGVSAIFLTDSHSDDEVWMVSGFIVFITIIAAGRSDASWKMKLGAVLVSALLVGIPATLITRVYPVNAIWMVPAIIVCLASFYTGVASGVILITFDGQHTDTWITGPGRPVAFPVSPDDPRPITWRAGVGKFQSYAEDPASHSRDMYNDGCAAVVEKALNFGFSDIVIARELGFNTSFPVFAYRKKIGFTQEQVITARIRTWGSLVAGGATVEEIAKAYGLTNPRTVQVQLWKAGFSWKTQSFAQLTLDQREAITRLVDEGTSDNKLAKLIGVKPFQVTLYRADQGLRNSRIRFR
ncbi:hypothetical protein DFQ30_001287 [Apophysomyces sp. BC1015]|nr:hypothetical protein DFQ30_001287 [Apophysomyces sp. BC1015]